MAASGKLLSREQAEAVASAAQQFLKLDGMMLAARFGSVEYMMTAPPSLIVVDHASGNYESYTDLADFHKGYGLWTN